MTQAEKILGWMYLAIQLLFLPAILNALNGLLKDPMGPATLNFVYYCINFVAICCIFATFLKKSFTHAGRSFWDFLQAAVLGFVAYWVCSWLIGHLVQLIRPGFANVNDAAISQMAGNSFWLMAIGVVILVPTVEECLYRGLVFRALHSKSRAAAYLLSMAVFAAFTSSLMWAAAICWFCCFASCSICRQACAWPGPTKKQTASSPLS